MRKIPIGTDDFRTIRREGTLYVDMSLFVREILDSPQVILLPRPRRFGKTLNMTMLHAFFDHSQDLVFLASFLAFGFFHPGWLRW